MEHGTRWIDEHYTFTPITIKLFNCLFVRVCECLCVCSNLNHRRTVDMDNINQLENCGTRQHSKKNALSPGEFSSPPKDTKRIVLHDESVNCLVCTVSVYLHCICFLQFFLILLLLKFSDHIWYCVNKIKKKHLRAFCRHLVFAKIGVSLTLSLTLTLCKWPFKGLPVFACLIVPEFHWVRSSVSIVLSANLITKMST